LQKFKPPLWKWALALAGACFYRLANAPKDCFVRKAVRRTGGGAGAPARPRVVTCNDTVFPAAASPHSGGRAKRKGPDPSDVKGLPNLLRMSVFLSAKHLYFWTGLVPQNNESAGKKKTTRIVHSGSFLKPCSSNALLSSVNRVVN
jgi:hypothetical protein